MAGSLRPVRRTSEAPSPSIDLRDGKGPDMFSRIYDKADWGVGVLLLAAIACAVFL